MSHCSRPPCRTTAVLLAALALFGAMLAPAGAIEPWRLVVRIEGRVESLEPGQTSWAPIFRSRRLNDGALARTQASSAANINLADQTSFRLGPNTEVEMTKFQLTAEGRMVVFNLRFGQIRADVAKALGRQSRFEVRTPNGVLAARGTQFSVTVMPEAELRNLQGKPSPPQAGASGVDALLAQTGRMVTLVTVREGVVVASLDGGRPLKLEAGDSAIIGADGILMNPPGFPLNRMLPSDQEPPDPRVRNVQGQASSFQDVGFQSGRREQFRRHFETEMRQTSNTLFDVPLDGMADGMSAPPPFFNPTNIANPLNNTPTSQPNTGTVNVIVR